MLLPPLIEGKILNRYKRFFADIELDSGEIVTAHCPNTGRMTSCWIPGARAQVSRSDNPRRKLPWTLERVDMGNGWIGVNTMRTNPVVAEALASEVVPGLEGYQALTREVTVSAGDLHGRLDIRLDGEGLPWFYIEVKSVTLWDGGHCLSFPDAVSKRAQKHLDLLWHLRRQGCRAMVLFALNRPEGECFRPAWEIDPGYARMLREVVADGVECCALRIKHNEDAMIGADVVPVVLDQAEVEMT